MTIVQCPHCNVFRNPEQEPYCSCKEAVRTLQEAMALIIAEHEVMRKRLIEIEEIYEDSPIRWRGSGEPIVQLDAEVQKFLKQKSEELRENERRQHRGFTGFSNN